MLQPCTCSSIREFLRNWQTAAPVELRCSWFCGPPAWLASRAVLDSPGGEGLNGKGTPHRAVLHTGVTVSCSWACPDAAAAVFLDPRARDPEQQPQLRRKEHTAGHQCLLDLQHMFSKLYRGHAVLQRKPVPSNAAGHSDDALSNELHTVAS